MGFDFSNLRMGLRFKVMGAVAGVLLVVMSGIFTWQYLQTRQDLIERVGLSATPLSDVIKASLKFAMQKRSMDDLEEIVRNVKMQEGVSRVMIFDKKGVVRVSGDEGEAGTKFDIKDETCQICHRKTVENRSRTVIFQSTQGYRIFRNVNPIDNEQSCQPCHDKSSKLNGVLITDFTMADVDRQLASKFRQMLLFLFVTLAATVGTIGLIMSRLVIGKVRRIAKATRLLSRGNLDHKLKEESKDEIGELAASFNVMIENLKRFNEIRERKELLENVLNNVKDSIIILDKEGDIISFSRGAVEMFEYQLGEVLGKNYFDLGPKRREAWQQAAQGQVFADEAMLPKKDGSLFPAFFTLTPLKDENGQLLALVEVASNLTQEKAREALQQQLIHSEKLAAAGRLAAGVAHELNNPLGNVLLYSKLLLEEAPAESPICRNLQKIVDNVSRSKKIISDLLDYTRQAESHMGLNHINEIAETAVRMLKNEMKINNVQCQLFLSPGLPAILCDRDQIQQVLVNLLQNAIEASEGQGYIELFTSLSQEGEMVKLAVKDDGRGILPQAVSKIFEPFYTTKDKGTGLGLSICYGIVKRHNGQIWAENGAAAGGNKGASFYVELPVPEYAQA